MKIGKKILILSGAITLVGMIIFLALIPISYSLVIGWMVGTLSVIATFSIGILFMKILFKNSKFKKGMLLTYLRIFIIFAFHIAVIMTVVVVDKSANGYSLGDVTQMNVMNSPINIFTYIAGVSVVSISTLIAHIFYKKRGE